MSAALMRWAAKHNIPPAALAELQAMAWPTPVASDLSGEAAVQQQIRAAAPRHGILWRNNTGALKNEQGTPVRFGLGNDSAAVNALIKSSDLIGITRVTVTPGHVGQVLGVFTAVEVKEPSWKHPSNDREWAQANFIRLARQHGALAGFAADVSHYERLICPPRG